MATEISEKPHQKMDFSQLSKAVGSKKGLDPMPPDQYEKKKDRRYSPAERIHAWAQAKTMGKDHRSPYCVDAEGRDLNIRDAAKELGMNRQLAERALAHLVAEGWLRTQGYRIYLNGDVDLKPLPKDPELESCDGIVAIPPYLLKQIKALPPETRRRFWDWKKAAIERSLRERREFAAVQRAIEEQEEDTFFSQIGLEKKHQPKRRADPSPLLPLLQPFLAAIVQSPNGHATIQTPKGGSYTPENPSVQSESGGASLYTENRDKTERAGAVLSSSSTVAILDKEKTSSLGRSMPDNLDRQNGADPPDRATTPLLPLIKEWLEQNCPVPGFPLQDAELQRIGATISSIVDFEDFQAAAANQKNPRGWRVYVQIAENCQKRREHYRQSKASKPVSEMSPDEREQIIQQALTEERKAKRAGAR